MQQSARVAQGRALLEVHGRGEEVVLEDGRDVIAAVPREDEGEVGQRAGELGGGELSIVCPP